MREEWQRRAASIGAWRELSGYAHPAEPIGPEPVTGTPDLRAAWHEALAALGPGDGRGVRGMPDGILLHLRDTYPIETAWAPTWTGDELRRARAGAWDARLAALRARAEATAAGRAGRRTEAARQRELAAGYQALHEAYRQREGAFAAALADRGAWEEATRAQRQLAIAADAELRHRHPGQHHLPLRSAEPEPPAPAPPEAPALIPEAELARMDEIIANLTAHRRQFTRQFSERTHQPHPAQNSAAFGPAFPAWAAEARDAILQPPRPQIEPSPRIPERVTGRDLDLEAAG